MISDIISTASDHMKRTYEALASEFATVRTGRASTTLFDKLSVEAYGAMMPINQVANLKNLDAQTILIEPWDKSVINAIDKAIQASDLGLTPSNDGSVIRVPFPSPTEERRIELVKLCKTYAENARIATRNVRRDANQHLERIKKEHEVSEDDVRRAETEIQKLTDAAIAEIDAALKRKEAEVMEV